MHTCIRFVACTAGKHNDTCPCIIAHNQDCPAVASHHGAAVQITVNGSCSTCCGGTATATLMGKSMRLAVAGEGLAAAVRVDPQVLHFGRVPCHEWADQVVQVHNVSLRSVLVVVDKGSANFQVGDGEPTVQTMCCMPHSAQGGMC
jgi:hypothetical protein